MPSLARHSSLLTVAVALLQTLSTTTAFPLTNRDTPAWSFNLYPTQACNATGDLHTGTGSTGCRADLHSVAAAYKLTSIPEPCRIEFFDNTMCDSAEGSDLAGPLTSLEACRIPGLGRRYGSYRVVCDGDGYEDMV